MSRLWSNPWFPHLEPDFTYVKSSDVDPTYNCIGYAADTRQWWQPGGDPDHYWPTGVPNEWTVNALILAYGTIGYVDCGNDSSFDPDFDKIAIYGSATPAGLVPTHAAKQIPPNSWTSKIGPEEDIEHYWLRSVSGPSYGNPIRFLKRPRQP